MSQDELLVEVDAGVAVVTFNRPERSNAMHPELGRRYGSTLLRLDEDPDVRVIVVTGAGSRFCGGTDLAFLAGDAEAYDAQALQVDEFPDVALRVRKPVIAAVNGVAYGSGVGFALASDIRFAAEHASFEPAFARLGLAGEYNLPWLMQRLVGVGRASEILLSGRRVAADEAASIGLVSDVFPSEGFLERVLDHAREMAATCSPRSMAVIKAQLWADAERPRREALAGSRAEMVASVVAGQMQEAFDARREHRAPRFPGLGPRDDL